MVKISQFPENIQRSAESLLNRLDQTQFDQKTMDQIQGSDGDIDYHDYQRICGHDSQISSSPIFKITRFLDKTSDLDIGPIYSRSIEPKEIKDPKFKRIALAMLDYYNRDGIYQLEAEPQSRLDAKVVVGLLSLDKNRQINSNGKINPADIEELVYQLTGSYQPLDKNLNEISGYTRQDIYQFLSFLKSECGFHLPPFDKTWPEFKTSSNTQKNIKESVLMIFGQSLKEFKKRFEHDEGDVNRQDDVLMRAVVRVLMIDRYDREEDIPSEVISEMMNDYKSKKLSQAEVLRLESAIQMSSDGGVTQNNWMKEARIAYRMFQSTMKAQGMTDLREDALSYIKESDPALGNQEDWIRGQLVEPEESDLYRKFLTFGQDLTYRSALMYSLFIRIASHTDF